MKIKFQGISKIQFFFGDVNFLTFSQLIKFNSNTLKNSLFHCNKPTSWLIMSVYSARINDVSPVITTRTVRVCVSLEPLHVTLSRIIETRTLCFPLPPPPHVPGQPSGLQFFTCILILAHIFNQTFLPANEQSTWRLFFRWTVFVCVCVCGCEGEGYFLIYE